MQANTEQAGRVQLQQATHSPMSSLTLPLNSRLWYRWVEEQSVNARHTVKSCAEKQRRHTACAVYMHVYV